MRMNSSKKPLPFFGWALLVLINFDTISFAQSARTTEVKETVVFQNGEAGYACFRIPAIVCSPGGLLLAFAEGRVQNCSDFGDVDIVLKTSSDRGQTWSALKVVASYDALQAGNPAPVFDLADPTHPEGRLFLFYNTGTTKEHAVREGKGIREVWYTTSTDEGRNWTAPVNITQFVNKPNMPAFNPLYKNPEDWRSYANTPGHALQLSNGRIFIPANHSSGPPQEHYRDYRAHAFFSDDHGKSWHLSPAIDYPGSNESTAAELPGNGVLMSIRNQSGDQPYRLLALSKNGGITWDSIWVAHDLPDPICQGSLLNFNSDQGVAILLHSNASSQTERCCLTVKISQDGGIHWEKWMEIYSGSTAYSDLVQVTEKTAGVLYEKDDYTKIAFAWFSLEN